MEDFLNDSYITFIIQQKVLLIKYAQSICRPIRNYLSIKMSLKDFLSFQNTEILYSTIFFKLIPSQSFLVA